MQAPTLHKTSFQYKKGRLVAIIEDFAISIKCRPVCKDTVVFLLDFNKRLINFNVLLLVFFWEANNINQQRLPLHSIQV